MTSVKTDGPKNTNMSAVATPTLYRSTWYQQPLVATCPDGSHR